MRDISTKPYWEELQDAAAFLLTQAHKKIFVAGLMEKVAVEREWRSEMKRGT
jgi:hypothetical protein